MKKLCLMTMLGSLSLCCNAEVIFKCHQPFSIFDPSFEQGSELYLDVSVDQNKEASLIFGRSSGANILPVDPGNTDHLAFSGDTTSFYAAWGHSSLSMVYTGNLTWGAFVKLGENDLGLPKEVEMQCRENVDILDFATGLN